MTTGTSTRWAVYVLFWALAIAVLFDVVYLDQVSRSRDGQAAEHLNAISEIEAGIDMAGAVGVSERSAEIHLSRAGLGLAELIDERKQSFIVAAMLRESFVALHLNVDRKARINVSMAWLTRVRLLLQQRLEVCSRETRGTRDVLLVIVLTLLVGSVVGFIAHTRLQRQRLSAAELRKADAEKTARHLSALLEELHDGVIQTDHEGRVRHANSIARRLVHAAEGIEGRALGTVLKSLELDDETLQVLSEPSHQTSTPREVRVSTSDGRHTDLLVSTHTIGEPGKSGTEHMVVMRDISEHKTTQAKLRDALDFQQSVIDSIDDPLMVIGLNHEVLMVNERAKLDSNWSERRPSHCYEVFHDNAKPCCGELHPCPLENVVRTGTPMRVVHEHISTGGSSFVQIIGSPLFADAGRLVGMVEFSHDVTSHIATERDLRAKARLHRYQATHDSLTRIPNRWLLESHLSTVIERNPHDEITAILFIDLDDFKSVNDQYGHCVGDDVLMKVAERLTSCLRRTDVVGRIGGDEFVFVLSGIQDPEESQVVARKILRAISEPICVGAKRITLSASIGIATTEDDPRESTILLRRADVAMYKAKEKGKNQFFVYVNPEATRH